MAEDTVVVEPELKLESPNMDEQSAAPKETPAEIIPDKEKVGGEKVETKETDPIETAEVEDTTAEPDGFKELPAWAKRELGQKQKQVQDRTQKLTEAEQRIADLEAMLKTGKTETEEASQNRTPTQNMTQAQIQAAAKELREQERYTEDLAKINANGVKSYGKEWDSALENIATFGTVEMPTMNAIRATDDPAKVLYELGKNPAEYQRIMELPPARQANEFAKLALKVAPKKTVSAAPEPVETIRTRATPSDAMPPDNATDDEWYAAWNARQEAKRKKTA